MQIQERFFEHLAIRPYCSFEKGAHQIRTKKHAIQRPYIQANPPHLCAWLIFDCDHTNIDAFREAGLPEPNWISITRGKGTYHMAYAIDPVYTTANARPKPLAYLAAIQRTYNVLLNADAGYSGLITKNPLHSDWATWWLHNHVYTLGELADYVDLLPSRRVPLVEESTGFGRNCDLFDLLRKWSYKAVLEHDLHSTFVLCAIEQAESYNSQFSAPLPLAEVKSVAKSVAKWTWRKRADFITRSISKKRKIGLNPDLTLSTKQSLGAAYTASVKAEATQSKIRAAIQMLEGRGEKPTQRAVAAITELSLRTIKSYWRKL